MSKEVFKYRPIEPEDVFQLQQLLRKCYGDSYFDTLYYDNNNLRKAIKTKKLRSIIALNTKQKIVAHIGIRIPEKSLTADSSLAIVDPDYRAKGLLVETGIRLYQLCLDLNLYGIYGRAVTVHTYTQQSNLKSGAAVTGIYLNRIPADQCFLETKQIENSVPTPAVIMLTPVAPPPSRKIYIPQQYSEQVQEVFKHCNMPRDLFQRIKPCSTKSVIKRSLKEKQKICNVWIKKIGDDFIPKIQLEINSLKSMDINAIYIHIALDQSHLDDSISYLRGIGFFYGGVLPEYSQRDWLILQYLIGKEPDFSDVQLAGSVANALFDYIISDYKNSEAP